MDRKTSTLSQLDYPLKEHDLGDGSYSLAVTVNGSLPLLTGAKASAYEAVTVADTAKALTALTYGTAKRALLTVETAQIRFRLDGTAPTATEGHIANPGDQIVLASNNDISKFKAIRTGSTSATIRCSYSSSS